MHTIFQWACIAQNLFSEFISKILYFYDLISISYQDVSYTFNSEFVDTFLRLFNFQNVFAFNQQALSGDLLIESKNTLKIKHMQKFIVYSLNIFTAGVKGLN